MGDRIAESDLDRFANVAVTHEWLTVPGGSEKVVAEILKLFPGAELFTTVFEPDAGWDPILVDRPVHVTPLDRIPGARTNYPKLLPLMDTAWRQVDLSRFDLVISSNHASAKNVRTGPATLHVCYCHTPMRYAWDPAFLAGEDLGRLTRVALPLLLRRLRRQDLRGARHVDAFVANSSFVAGRIRDCYGRDARVVHPPVDVDRYLEAPREAGDAYLVFGRVVPYKRVELAVAACERLGRRVIVAGDGRGLDRVRAVAGRHTEFRGHVSDRDLADLFARSHALLFPGEEDFGIVPVEAQAAGLPVIAFGSGGARDSVIDGVTGVLFEPQTVDGLCAAIERFEALDLDDCDLREQARGFAPAAFAAGFTDAVLSAAGQAAR
jgi:glycosyltransferase involved in cell wall biosynthesis